MPAGAFSASKIAYPGFFRGQNSDFMYLPYIILGYSVRKSGIVTSMPAGVFFSLKKGPPGALRPFGPRVGGITPGGSALPRGVPPFIAGAKH